MFNRFALFFVVILWLFTHIYLWEVNEVMKVADSFAYIQMAEYAKSLDINAFWSWWFWFFYSILWVPLLLFIDDSFLAFKLLNLILLLWTIFILFKLARKVLDYKYSIFVVWLFLFSSTLTHFNIHVLSENIYIPLFLTFFYLLLSLGKWFSPSKMIFIGLVSFNVFN